MVGSGLAGLTAAVTLQRAGVRVTLFDGGAGRVGSMFPSPEFPAWRVETGAPSVTHRAEAVFRFAEQIGLGVPGGDAWRQLSPAARDRFVADGERLRPVGLSSLGLRQAAEFSRGMLRHRPPQPDETVADWARLQFGASLANGFARALTVGIWGCAPEHVGFADAWPELHAALQTVSPLSLQKQLPGRAQGSVAPRGGTWTLSSGMGRLATAARRALEDAGGIVISEPVGRLDDLDVDRVVVATDAHDAARLLPGAAVELSQVRHAPMAVVHWLAAPQERPRGFGLLVPPGDPVLGTLFVSDVLDDAAPPELSAYTTTFGGYASPDQLLRSDSALVADVSARHARWFGAEPRIVAAHVVRWPRAVSIPSVGHRARIAQVQQALAERDGGRVVLAGAYLSGGTLDDAVVSGFSAAERAAQAASG